MFPRYIFLEDDMLLNESNTQVCNNGFVKYIDNLYHGLIAIMEKDKYDFIKMSKKFKLKYQIRSKIC